MAQCNEIKHDIRNIQLTVDTKSKWQRLQTVVNLNKARQPAGTRKVARKVPPGAYLGERKNQQYGYTSLSTAVSYPGW